MASEFLDVNLLFGAEVNTTLVNEQLEKWNLMIEMIIAFTKIEKKKEDIQIKLQGP